MAGQRDVGNYEANSQIFSPFNHHHHHHHRRHQWMIDAFAILIMYVENLDNAIRTRLQAVDKGPILAPTSPRLQVS